MRSELIDEVLREHYLDIGVAVSAASAEEYAALPHRPEKRLGIYGPLPYPGPDRAAGPGDPPYLMAWSSDYLARVTDGLTAEEADHFLEIITYIGDMMIALGREVPEEVERFRTIEDRFIDEWPESLDLLNRVELRALDAGLG